MNPAVEQVLDHVRGAWRFRWPALIVAWVVCLGGWLIVLSLPDMYEASAKVYVDTRTALRPILQGIALESDVDSQLLMVQQALLGRPHLERVAQATNLFKPDMTLQQRAAFIDDLRSRIKIEGGDLDEGGGLYVISYQDTQRDRSIEVVETLLKAFVSDTLGGKKEGSESAQRFLREQIAEYEQRLAQAEARLADFKRKNVGLMPGEQGDYFARLQSEIDAAQKVESQLSNAIRRRDELERQLKSEIPYLASVTTTPGGVGVQRSGTPANDTMSRIQETQSRLDELLLRYTEKHPDVVALKETLEQLKQKREAELDALRRGDPAAIAAAGAAASPVYQSIQLAFNQAEVEIATLRGELADRRRKIAELRALVNTAPEVEAEFARLNRDYDVTRAQYNALVERLEKARLTDDAAETGVVKFDIVDPPAAPFYPVAPNRLLLLAMVLAGGLGAGGGLAYLLHQFRPVFTNTRTLNEITGLPVLGVVSMTWVEKHRAATRIQRIAFSGAAAMLFIAFATVMLFHSAAVRLLHPVASG